MRTLHAVTLLAASLLCVSSAHAAGTRGKDVGSLSDEDPETAALVAELRARAQRLAEQQQRVRSATLSRTSTAKAEEVADGARVRFLETEARVEAQEPSPALVKATTLFNQTHNLYEPGEEMFSSPAERKLEEFERGLEADLLKVVGTAKNPRADGKALTKLRTTLSSMASATAEHMRSVKGDAEHTELGARSLQLDRLKDMLQHLEDTRSDISQRLREQRRNEHDSQTLEASIKRIVDHEFASRMTRLEEHLRQKMDKSFVKLKQDLEAEVSEQARKDAESLIARNRDEMVSELQEIVRGALPTGAAEELAEELPLQQELDAADEAEVVDAGEEDEVEGKEDKEGALVQAPLNTKEEEPKQASAAQDETQAAASNTRFAAQHVQLTTVSQAAAAAPPAEFAAAPTSTDIMDALRAAAEPSANSGAVAGPQDAVEEAGGVDVPAETDVNGQAMFRYSQLSPVGPQNWGKWYPTCGDGLQQSPIDIITQGPHEKRTVMFKPSLPTINAHYQSFGGNGDDAVVVVNNGHSILVNYPRSDKYDGTLMYGTAPYRLKQFHFHAPSEHRVDGRDAAIELQLVHEYVGELLGQEPQFLSVSVLYDVGAEADPLLSRVFRDLPGAPLRGATVPSVTPLDNVYLSLTLPVLGANNATLAPAAYYTYVGSLTTPPCAEGVRWVVLKSRKTASPEQVDALRNVLPEGRNARPVQNEHWRGGMPLVFTTPSSAEEHRTASVDASQVAMSLIRIA